MIRKNLKEFRKEYTSGTLIDNEVHGDPFWQFGTWFDQAIQAGVSEPNAMTLATVSPDNKPAARIVLLKELDERGFVFYTNYLSNKGRQLALNPHAALVFLWLELQRQVRIEGSVHKISTEESDAYFASRPRESQLGAIASPQSKLVASRASLEETYRQLEKEKEGQHLERPEHWGGYRLIPESFEFWQGRSGRLHDRILYARSGHTWKVNRLAP
jgi:pyridoxamine 5'-phosphate oxidase